MDFMQKVSYCEEGNIVSVRPYVTQEVVIRLAKDLYGLDIDVSEEIKELVSYSDRNFLVKGIMFNLSKLLFLLLNDLCKTSENASLFQYCVKTITTKFSKKIFN